MSMTEQELCTRIAKMDAARSSYLLLGQINQDILHACGVVRPHDSFVNGADAWQAFEKASTICSDAEKNSTFQRLNSIEDVRTFWTFKALDYVSFVEEIRIPALRAIGACAKQDPSIFVAVDITDVTPVGCMPLKMGAQVVFYQLPVCAHDDRVVWVVSLMQSKARKHAVALDNKTFFEFERNITAYRDKLGGLDSACLLAVENYFDALEHEVVTRNDHANALAQYLRCHPCVREAQYPSLPLHPDKSIAASVLMHGFGSKTKLILDDRYVLASSVVERFNDAAAQSAEIIKTLCSVVKGTSNQVILLDVGCDNPTAVMKCLEQALFSDEIARR